MLIKACLNGGRAPGEHPALPLSPEELARDARGVVDAGAGALHLHPRGPDGAETLRAEDVGLAVSAVRGACPDVPVGVSTGAWISHNTEERAALMRTWRSIPENARPDFASVNLSEGGSLEVCEALVESGIGIEAGVWSADDARFLLDTGLQERCVRILIEPVREKTAREAIETSRGIERLLDDAGVRTPRLLHGKGDTAWPILEYALERDLDIRIGLEDTLVTPAGEVAGGNEHLVREAVRLVDHAAKREQSRKIQDGSRGA